MDGLDLPKQCSREKMKGPRACRTRFKTLAAEGERSWLRSGGHSGTHRKYRLGCFRTGMAENADSKVWERWGLKTERDRYWLWL